MPNFELPAMVATAPRTGELLLLGGGFTEILTYTGPAFTNPPSREATARYGLRRGRLTFGPRRTAACYGAPYPSSPTHLTNNLTYA